MSEQDEHPNPYVRHNVGSADEVARWEVSDQRKRDPQWQAVDTLVAIFRSIEVAQYCLVVIVVLLGLMLWRVW